MSGAFRRIMQVQVANLLAETLAWNFIYLQAHNAGHSEAYIAGFFAVMFVVAALAVPLVSRRVPTGPSMALGLSLRIVALVVVVEVAVYGRLVAAAAIQGVFIVLFWIPYNVVFLRMTSASDRAGRSTKLFALFAVTGAVFPLVGGYIIEWQGFAPVVAVACVALVAGAYVAARTPWGEPMRFDLRRSFRRGRGRRIVPMVSLEGFWQGVFWIAVPIGTLRMVDQGIQYGAFLAFLGVMAGVASVVAGRWSDRTRDRWAPLAVSTVGVAVFTVVVAFTEGDLILWSLASGMTYFFTYMMMAFTFTVVAEMGLDLDDTMGLREVMLNVGRTAGAGLFIVTLLLGITMLVPLAVASLLVLAMLAGYRRVLVDGGTGTAP